MTSAELDDTVYEQKFINLNKTVANHYKADLETFPFFSIHKTKRKPNAIKANAAMCLGSSR